MMDGLAKALDAERLEEVSVTLDAYDEIRVPRLLRREVRAPEPIPRQSSCWAPNKPALEFEGMITWAELIVVRLLRNAGWDARWIKNWTGGREPCTAVGRREPLPGPAAATLRRIDDRAAIGTSGGAWDVFAWRGNEYLCIESKKHRSSDKLRESQVKWMAAAMAMGITDFAIVEYDPGPPLVTMGKPSSAPAPDSSQRSRRRSSSLGRSGVLGPEFAASAPRGQGCEWLTKSGRPCQNPANYRVDGKWSCSRDHRPR